MANIENVTIELVGGARLTIRQDGDIVEITADTDATYKVIQFRRRRSMLELRFDRGMTRRQQSYFRSEETD